MHTPQKAPRRSPHGADHCEVHATKSNTWPAEVYELRGQSCCAAEVEANRTGPSEPQGELQSHIDEPCCWGPKQGSQWRRSYKGPCFCWHRRWCDTHQQAEAPVWSPYCRHRHYPETVGEDQGSCDSLQQWDGDLQRQLRLWANSILSWVLQRRDALWSETIFLAILEELGIPVVQIGAKGLTESKEGVGQWHP